MQSILAGLDAYLMSGAAVGLLVVRLIIGAIFYVHTQGKDVFWKAKPSAEMSAGQINMMKFISLAEMLGMLAMFLGFMTQLAAVGLGIIMLGAIYSKIKLWKVPFSAPQGTGWEFDLMILAGCIALATHGAGPYSLDAWWLNI